MYVYFIQAAFCLTDCLGKRFQKHFEDLLEIVVRY